MSLERASGTFFRPYALYTLDSAVSILKHIEAVKESAPRLLTDFPKIDQDGRGKITAEHLERSGALRP